MLNMNYVGEVTNYAVEFHHVNENRVKLVGDFPAKTKGFILTRINNPIAFKGDYSNYTTIYRKYKDGSVEFSNNNEVYDPYRNVTFYTLEGGTLEGETNQRIKDYSELVVPTPVANEEFEFVEWTPEIPTEGEILKDTMFKAVFKDTFKHVTFFVNEGGELEGELEQRVKDFSELIVPTPVAHENYEFVGWTPEIPTEGEVEFDQAFTAMFRYTLPTMEERMTAAEEAIAQNTSDIADTQDALCELSVSTVSSITDLEDAVCELSTLE